MVRDGRIMLPAGDIPEPFVDLDDLADVVVTALTEPGHTGKLYELTGPRLLTFADVATELSRALGQPVEFEPIPHADFLAALTEALDRSAALAQAAEPAEQAETIRQGRRRIEAIARDYAGAVEVQARVALEQAELLIADGDRTRAIQSLEALSDDKKTPSAVAARAMLRRIELLGIVHDPEALSEAYAQITARFPEERTVVGEAASRLVDVHLAAVSGARRSRSRVDVLRPLVSRYGPGPIRRAARWKLVSELRDRKALDAAAVELTMLVHESTDDRYGRARALRALAEIDEGRGAPAAAVESWRQILQQYADLPGYAAAARTAISRVNLARAAANEARGDLEAARQAYARVIDNDFGQVEAHRRYIALSARLGRLDEVLDVAERRAKRSMGTPVARYAYALALTWRNPPDLGPAYEEVDAAIGLNPQFTEAYLLRGWIYEMQELEEPSWFVETMQVIYERVIESIIAVFASDQDEVGQLGNLELAIEDYKTALRLNNESIKPRLEAEILLNLGNGHYRLANDTNDPPNMRQAFDRYGQVVALKYRFDSPGPEMVFWERFGRAASWAEAYAVSAMATRRALSLATELKAGERRLQQLGNLALAYDQADEEAYAQDARRQLAEAGAAEAAAGRAAIRLREKARARLLTPDDRTVSGLEQVLEDLALARQQLDALDGDPRELPTLWIALSPNPTSAQYGFGPRAERNLNLALAERAHRFLGDISRADALAGERSALALDRFDDIPGSALGFLNKWPTTLFQVRERLGLLLLPARAARAAGRWRDAYTGLLAAKGWLDQTVESVWVSGSRAALWLERARWAATAAEWQAEARASGVAALPDELSAAETLEGVRPWGRASARPEGRRESASACCRSARSCGTAAGTQQRVARLRREGDETGPGVREDVSVRQRDGLRGALGTGREENRGDVVRRHVGQLPPKGPGPQAGSQGHEQRLALGDPLAESFQEQELGSVDLDAEPIDELLRRDDVREVRDLDCVFEPGGPRRPVEQDRRLSRHADCEVDDVRRDRGGQHDAHVLGLDLANSAGEEFNRDEQSPRRQHARGLVRDRDGIGVGEHSVQERLGDRLAKDADRFSPRLRIEPGPRCGPRFGRPGRESAVGEGAQFANRGGDFVGPKAEPVLDGERDVHAVEAVETELVERGVGRAFLVVQRPTEVLLDDRQHGRDRLRGQFREIDVAARVELGEVERPPTEQQVVRNVRRRLRTVRVVPVLERLVEFATVVEWQRRTVDDLDLHRHPPSRQEHEQ